MIVLQFDRHYYHWAHLALTSLALHEPNIPVFADTVNLSRQQADALYQAHSGLTITNRSVGEHAEFKAFMANRKATVLLHAMDQFKDVSWFALLDVDILVRRPLDDLWRLLANSPVAVPLTDGMWRGRYYHHLEMPSCVVLVRSDGRKLVENWTNWLGHKSAIHGIQPRAWYWDQVTLLKAWHQSQLKSNFISVHVFSNSDLDRNAAIWSANVQDKAGHYRRFQAEHAFRLAETAER